MTTAVDLSHTLSLVPNWLLQEVFLLDIQTLLTFIQSTRIPGGRVIYKQNHLELESYLICELQQIVCQNQLVKLLLFPMIIASSLLEEATGIIYCSLKTFISIMLIMMNG